jgi:hypothetical protein
MYGNSTNLHSFTAYVRFEVFRAVNIKNTIFWDETPCGSCKNDVSEESITSIIRVEIISEIGTKLATT